MYKLKKISIGMVGILLIVVITIVGIFAFREWQKIETQHREELQIKYEQSNFALGMNAYNCYKDFSNVDVNDLIISLAAYKHFEKDVEISVEDVKEFLSSEYDKKGKPYVLNPPDNIAKYIDWYIFLGGHLLRGKYFIYLSRFQDDNKEKYSFESLYILDEKLLYELIEDFENCPDRKSYEIY